ncbi:hypothetical protein BVRB_3g063120 [Beta vulgaris subsp. vulgaris]|nr:hypothetical protein BVRB_3g063120 [Beta vulgaris subsp. vulgaris]
MQQFSDDFPATTSSEMEIYRYLAGGGEVNDVVNWPAKFNNKYSSSGSCSASFYPGFMNETAEAKALAASRIHHKEAEKRRRERINSHLDRLRSILPCTSKTDKATLLSKVVQRVLELKRQTSEIHELDNMMIPSENDEFAVYIHNNNSNECDNNEDGDHINVDSYNDNKLILKASLCCEDRPDLFADLNGVLSSLNMKTLRAEMSSLGGRIQSVFVVSADNDTQSDECAVFLRDALKGIVQRSGSEERLKRRRRVFDATTDC